MTNFIKKQSEGSSTIILIIAVFLLALLAFILSFKREFRPPVLTFPPTKPPSLTEIADIKKFASAQEFRAYLAEGAQGDYFGFGGLATRGIALEDVRPMELGVGLEEKAAGPERVSETTVQVVGIDEPDIVKTDGEEIYFSRDFWRSWSNRPVILEQKIGIPEEKISTPSVPQEANTSVIKAFPPARLAREASIDQAGNLLLAGNNLVIFAHQEIYGYDVSNPSSPEETWKLEFDGNNSLVAARLYKNKIYFVTQTRINELRPCPIEPLKVRGESLTISCEEIYHPVRPVPVDVTFTAMELDPASGRIQNKTSFVGSSGASIVYMSPQAVYVTYNYSESVIKFYFDFFKTYPDLVSRWLVEKMEKLESYDLSEQAKLVEFQLLWQKYFDSLDQDQKLRQENELNNKMLAYYREHQRSLEKTGMVKIQLTGLALAATGSVPGRLLNQFALDEYQDHLRVATTVGERRGFFNVLGRLGTESANDVYVLDEDLEVVGKVQDLGLTERIYSARFIEDKGYIVTFRQTDPFYVLDLSDPSKPELKGELKIPGYSAYLQPITKDKILGIGKEGWQIKISLFDVSRPAEPRELAKYILDEGWSEVLSTHHAFLLDTKHQIFFLPGGKGGYVFSYQNNQLELVRAVGETSTRRALYLNDYLYILSDSKITVLNEIDWQEVNKLEL